MHTLGCAVGRADSKSTEYDSVKMYHIFKYRLDITDMQEIYLPKGAKILSVIFQVDQNVVAGSRENPYQLVLYAIVDKEQIKESRTIFIFGTGHSMNDRLLDKLKFIATVPEPVRPLIWHVFEYVG